MADGAACQRSDLNNCRVRPAAKRRRKFKEWVVGMVLFSIGNVLNFVSFGEWCMRTRMPCMLKGGQRSWHTHVGG